MYTMYIFVFFNRRDQVKVITGPDKKESVMEKLERYSKQLADIQEDDKPDTFFFLFSGHHKDDRFMIGNETDVSSQELFGQMHTITSKVSKIIVLLDCCYATFPCFCSQINFRNKTYVLLNGGLSTEKQSSLRNYGSIFTQTIVQALRSSKKNVKKDQCILRFNNESCKICTRWNAKNEDFITLIDLLRYESYDIVWSTTKTVFAKHCFVR